MQFEVQFYDLEAVYDLERNKASRRVSTMLADAEVYNEHQSMLVRDTELFVKTAVRKMDWSRQEQDVVMDIGCGPGNSCHKMLFSTFPRVKKVIGIDVLEKLIEFAKANNTHEKIEYHVADIENRNTITKWSQQISKVISVYCFNWLGNQSEAFKNIYHMLRPGGEAALFFGLRSPFWDSYEMHYKNPKWSKYLENKRSYVPESHFKKYGAAFYRNLLQDIGFDIIICEDEKRNFSYPSDDDCRSACFSRCALACYIPDELKPEFKEDVFQGFLKYNGRDSNGKPMIHHTVLTLLLQKPSE